MMERLKDAWAVVVGSLISFLYSDALLYAMFVLVIYASIQMFVYTVTGGWLGW